MQHIFTPACTFLTTYVGRLLPSYGHRCACAACGDFMLSGGFRAIFVRPHRTFPSSCCCSMLRAVGSSACALRTGSFRSARLHAPTAVRWCASSGVTQSSASPSSAREVSVDVAVVGAGIVGSAFACRLGMFA
ncbi:hypothetical protein EON67_05630 [archaeon]|nr:MAG: hypothetical protein EON67_05630 [archaeon]